MQVELLYPDNNSVSKILYARRMCTGKPSVLSPEKAIASLCSCGHLSVLEHGVATIWIHNISRVTSHQIVRHRLMSVTQESNRVVSVRGKEVVIPPSLTDMVGGLEEATICENFKRFADSANTLYDSLVEGGITSEDVRYLFPSGVTTSLVLTGNFRNWLHFLLLRLHPSSQAEIREVARKVFCRLHFTYPEVFNTTNLSLIKYAPEFKEEYLEDTPAPSRVSMGE